MAVTSQTAISRPGEPTWRAISAETMKMPEPIIEPITIVVASRRPRPLTNPPEVAAGVASASGMGVRIEIVPLGNAALYVVGRVAEGVEIADDRRTLNTYVVKALGIFEGNPTDGH